MSIPKVPILANFAVSQENTPVDLWDTLGPPPFPKGLAPKIVEDFAIGMSIHTGADPSGYIMAALTVAGSAIPDRIKIQPKIYEPNWQESGRLWSLLIGPPSSKKTPIINAAVRPVGQMDARFMRDWQQQHKAWLVLPKEDRAQRPEPIPRRIRIEDITVEAAQEVLKNNLDGVLCVQDEATAFFGMMERYGSGKSASSDRPFWLRAYNGGEYAFNRIGRGSALIENLSIAFLGGIQPEPLRRIVSNSYDDGLLQRMIPIALRPADVGLDRERPNVQAAYDFTLTMLSGLAIAAPLRFDEDAQILREYCEQKYHRLQSVELINRQLASHIGKFDGLFARLCVIWHVLEHGFNLPPLVSYETAERVAMFMDKFILPHVGCFYSNLGLSDDHDKVKAVAEYILAHQLPQVTVRDVQRGTRAMRKMSAPDVLPILQQLVAFGWLAQTPQPSGRNDPFFIVHPAVHQLFAKRAASERERRERARSVMMECFGK